MTRAHSIVSSGDQAALEIDGFRSSIPRWKQGKVRDAVFLEQRLRLGVYGQRQDGVHMMRSKIPLGILDANQLEALADVAEHFGNGTAHLTTRQDVQVHFVDLDESPMVMEVLHRVETTTKEACGNVVRNVTAAETAGIDPNEVFDVTRLGLALSRYLLAHPDGQSLGRKFKVHLSGSEAPSRDHGAFHDLGLRAVSREEQGQIKHGVHVVVGGGLGAIAYEAQLLAPFVPLEELGPVVRAVLVVFARHGEKRKRARARLKFLVAQWGIERFREEVEAVQNVLGEDPRWNVCWTQSTVREPSPRHPPGKGFPESEDAKEAAWLRTNVMLQRQPGYAAVRIRVPQGDLNPGQLRGLATILRDHSGETLRVTVGQGLLLRWIPLDRLTQVRRALESLSLEATHAEGLGDTVTCPGADTCKLGVTSPRLAARAMQDSLDALARNPRLERLRVHISGCPNACARHQIADLGFFGAVRRIGGHALPHYMVVLGGRESGKSREELGDGFGTVVSKVPASRLATTVERLTGLFLEEALPDEEFSSFYRRVGRKRVQNLLKDLAADASEADKLSHEPLTAQRFQVRRGTGECAGQLVTAADLDLATADRKVEAALRFFEQGRAPSLVAEHIRSAFLAAARALLTAHDIRWEHSDDVPERFKTSILEPGLMHESTGLWFLSEFEQVVSASAPRRSNQNLRRRCDEASLFVEEVHSMLARQASPGGGQP